MISMLASTALFVSSALLASLVSAQGSLPSAFPTNYSGIPAGDYSPAWQSCKLYPHHLQSGIMKAQRPKDFLVNTERLPNVTFPLGNSYAGNVYTDRAGHPNNTLFFWAFENEGKKGSLTSPATEDPLIFWFSGG
jgi:carboxypeptidase D